MAIKKFAAVAGEDVFTIFTFDDDPQVNDIGPRLAAGMASDPKIIEIDNDSNITVGWTYNGSSFIEPVE